MLQIFAGVDSHFLAGYPMSSEGDYPRAMEDFIRENGAPYGMMSDNAKSEISFAAKNLHRLYCIRDRQSEPHYQHQNPVERRIQDVKHTTENVMDRVGCAAKFWLIATLFVIGLLNVMCNVNGEIPNSVVTGEMTDVSPYLSFHFWQEVFYEEPGKNPEKLGRWCGPADGKGDKLTYWILTKDTEQLIVRSGVRPAKDPLFPNLRARPDDSHSPARSAPVFSLSDTLLVGDSSALEVPKFSPDNLLGLTFLHDVGDGERMRAKITRKILDREAEDHKNIKFLISYGDDTVEEIIGYNELSDIVDRQHQEEAEGSAPIWTFKSILDHKKVSPGTPEYKGSSYNVFVLWEDGSKTWEPLNMVSKDDPVTLAAYAKDHDLLETPGWKFLRRIAKREKVLKRMLNQARRQSKNDSIRYQFGVQVPRSVQEAYKLDQENGNELWRQAMDAEINQLLDYETFVDKGMIQSAPEGYQLIKCRMIFAVKQDGRRMGCLVAGGHMTKHPEDSVYSSVVSL